MFASVRQFIVTFSILAGILFSCGCQPIAPSGPGASTDTQVTVSQLAARLGLALEQLNNRQYKLHDAHNTAFIFTRPAPKAYVNGRYIASFAARYSRSGDLLIPTGVLLQMRSALWAPAVPDTTSVPLSSVPVTPVEPARRGQCVVIDPGHGGVDPGTTACRRASEKQVNLIIARRVAAMLDKRGYRVILTRSDDRAVPLESRPAVSNRAGADLFVSIHADSNPDPARRGFTVFIQRSVSDRSASARAAAALVRTLGTTGMPGHGLRRSDYRVLVKNRRPAVLIECGHLSNHRDAALLTSETFQDTLAVAIADGIESFLSR